MIFSCDTSFARIFQLLLGNGDWFLKSSSKVSPLYPILLKYHYSISIIFIFCLCSILLHHYLAASAVSLCVHQKLSLKYNSWIGAVSLWLTCQIAPLTVLVSPWRRFGWFISRMSSGVLSLGISVLSSSTKLSFLFGLRILMALEGIVI